MKYFVTIAGREIPVEVDGDRVVVEGREVRAHLTVIPGTPIRHLLLGAESVALLVERNERGGWQLGIEGTGHGAEVVDERTRHIRSLTAGAEKLSGVGQLRAPMPGLVVRVLVEEGQTASGGQGLIVLEAMKMENELRSPAGGRVAAIRVAPGQAVDKGQVLLNSPDPAGGGITLDLTHSPGLGFKSVRFQGLHFGASGPMNTFSAKPSDISHEWHVVDAQGVPLGRLASHVAQLIRGKHKPTFTPHMDGGDFVVVVNAEKVKLTGRKLEQKRHFRHTGYMGHERYTPVKNLLQGKFPERVIEHAVFGMLPKNSLTKQKLRTKLKVYAGGEHPHVAQQPVPYSVTPKAK